MNLSQSWDTAIIDMIAIASTRAAIGQLWNCLRRQVEIQLGLFCLFPSPCCSRSYMSTLIISDLMFIPSKKVSIAVKRCWLGYYVNQTDWLLSELHLGLGMDSCTWHDQNHGVWSSWSCLLLRVVLVKDGSVTACVIAVRRYGKGYLQRQYTPTSAGVARIGQRNSLSTHPSALGENGYLVYLKMKNSRAFLVCLAWILAQSCRYCNYWYDCNASTELLSGQTLELSRPMTSISDVPSERNR